MFFFFVLYDLLVFCCLAKSRGFLENLKITYLSTIYLILYIFNIIIYIYIYHIIILCLYINVFFFLILCIFFNFERQNIVILWIYVTYSGYSLYTRSYSRFQLKKALPVLQPLYTAIMYSMLKTLAVLL